MTAEVWDAPPGSTPRRSPEVRLLSGFARVVLVLVTLLFLSSIGGAMAVAMPFLVPLHWLAARTGSKWGRAGWVLLAALSIWEAVFIYVALLEVPLAVVYVASVGAAIATAAMIVTTPPTLREHRPAVILSAVLIGSFSLWLGWFALTHGGETQTSREVREAPASTFP